MKIVGVGDLVIPEDTMEEIFKQQNRLKGQFFKASWGVNDSGQLQHLRSIYEEKGPGAVPAPRHILRDASDAQVLMVHFTPISAEIISGLPELKIIGTARAGIENIDIEAAEKRGVLVMHGGFDSFNEELYFLVRYFSERGYEVIAFDGPGQGRGL